MFFIWQAGWCSFCIVLFGGIERSSFIEPQNLIVCFHHRSNQNKSSFALTSKKQIAQLGRT